MSSAFQFSLPTPVTNRRSWMYTSVSPTNRRSSIPLYTSVSTTNRLSWMYTSVSSTKRLSWIPTPSLNKEEEEVEKKESQNKEEEEVEKKESQNKEEEEVEKKESKKNEEKESEKALDIVDLIDDIVDLIGSVTQIGRCLLAYVGISFVFALVNTVRKFTSPEVEKKELEKNEEKESEKALDIVDLIGTCQPLCHPMSICNRRFLSYSCYSLRPTSRKIV